MSLAARSLRLRAAQRAPIALRASRPTKRFASSMPDVSSETKTGASSGLVGGLIGGGLVVAAGYGYYHFSGLKTAVNTMHGAKGYLDQATNKLKEAGNLKPDQTMQWIQDMAGQYAAFIPGGKGMVDTAFKEINEIKKEHGEELEKVMKDAYDEIKGIASKGSFDVATAGTAWAILVKYMDKVQELAKNIGEDVLGKHPEIKEKFGGKLEQLKELGEKNGGEIQKQVQQTYKQVTDMVKSGKIDSDKISSLVSEGMKKAQDASESAKSQFTDKIKPFVEKNPAIKKMIDENMDKLKSGQFGDLVKQIESAAKSGKTDDLQNYLKEQTSQIAGMSSQAWDALMVRASIYLDKVSPDLRKYVEENANKIKKIDPEELFEKLRKAKDSGDIKPVKEYIEKQMK